MDIHISHWVIQTFTSCHMTQINIQISFICTRRCCHLANGLTWYINISYLVYDRGEPNYKQCKLLLKAPYLLEVSTSRELDWNIRNINSCLGCLVCQRNPHPKSTWLFLWGFFLVIQMYSQWWWLCLIFDILKCIANESDYFQKQCF